MVYDIIIIGAAPAGLTAALYGARQGNSVLVIEKDEPGGQAIKTNIIENYPGTSSDSSGSDIISAMVKQAEEFGAEIVKDEVVSVELKDTIKTITGKEKEYKAKAVIIATGAFPRKLGVPGEEEFTGKGVGYCATCDAPLFQDLDVYVVGGGNSAVDEGLYLTKFAKKVTILVRGDKLTCDKITADKAQAHDKIEIYYNKSITELRGNGLLNEMTIVDNKTGEETIIKPRDGDMLFGVFVFIGYLPNTDIFKQHLNLEHGYIPTDEDMRTELDKVYAAGDVRVKNLRQVVTAVSDGAIAAHFAGRDLDK